MTDSKQKKEKKLITAITPVDTKFNFEDIFYALALSENKKYISFLDSSLSPNRFSNYSYLGWEPEFVIKSAGMKNESIDLSTGGPKEEVRSHPIKFLEQILKKNIFRSTENIILDDLNCGAKPDVDLVHSAGKVPANISNPGKCPEAGNVTETCNHAQSCIGGKPFNTSDGGMTLPDFKGGLIGYFSYDLKNYIEKLPSKAKKDIRVPIFYLCYYLKFLAFNHQSGRCYFVKNYETTPEEMTCGVPCGRTGKNADYYTGCKAGSEKSYADHVREDMLLEKQKITRLLKRRLNRCNPGINNLIIKKYKEKHIGDPEFASNFSKPDYIKAILKTKEHIHNGDIYQANISQRFSCSMDVDPADLYYMLRQKNPAPFCAYLSFPGLKIGCSSPERFMFLKDGHVETRPIKGTRPRGKTLEEEGSNIKELQESLKDHAELNMIVDLERNDLGRFCKYGTVKVKEHAVIEKYARVFHLVSTVTGQLQEGYNHTDIIKAAFPGGSITGAPKIRAMEIIDSLEPTARNVYTGSIGYIGLDGTMDLNIAIRTFVIKKKKFYYNVGGGIVEDSTPESEYIETLDKGVALKETLEFFLQKNIEEK